MSDAILYEVRTQTRLTASGERGLGLFLASPVINVLALWMLGDLTGAISILFSCACLIGFLWGFASLIIGREYVAYHKS